MAAIIAFFVRNRLFGDLITAFIVIMGLISATQIKREVFPNVDFDVILIETFFPGASAEEVEKLVSSPLEQDLQEVEGIKKLQSVSIEGQSRVILYLDPDQTTVNKAKTDVQDVIDLFKKPEGSEDPLVVSLDSSQQPIIEVGLTANVPEMELRAIAKDLEKRVEAIRGVSKVVHRGLRDREIKIEVDPVKLNQLGLSLDAVAQAVELQNRTIPAGLVEPKDNGLDTIVRTVGDYQNLDEIKNTVVRANELGRPIRVSDIASVSMDFDKAQILNRTNGQPSVAVVVLKKEAADAIDMVDQLKAVMGQFIATKAAEGKTVAASYINDFSYYIRRRVSILTSNLVFGLILIVLVLGLFLPFRVAAVAVTGVVLAFAATIYYFDVAGHSVNLISLLGLIIVSGMLVDDAIVVSDNIVRRMELGESPNEAAINGTVEIWPSVAASVLTTVTAFLPMMFMSGIFGKFIKQIPLGVISALMFSLLEALWILPQHMAHWVSPASLKLDRTSKSLVGRFRVFWEDRFVPGYVSWVRFFLHHRYKTVLGLLLFFSLSMFVATQKLKFILFPPDGVEIFFVRVKTPTGFSLERTLTVVEPIEAAVKTLSAKELTDFVTTVGLVEQDPNDPTRQVGSEYAQIAVYLTPETERDRSVAEIIEDLRTKVGTPQNLEKITFERVNTGPPVGKPISVGLRGENYDDLIAAAKELKGIIAKLPGAKDIDDNFIPGKEEIQLVVNRAEAAAAGVSVAQIGRTVRMAFDGTTATAIRELEDEIDIRVQLRRDSIASSEVLSLLKIPNSFGNLIPLSRVTSQVRKRNLSVYQHEANQREVRVLGEVDTNVTSATALAARIDAEIKPLIEKNHPRVKLVQGGEDEDTQESLASLKKAFLAAFMGIFLILVLTFKNLLQPFLVVLTIPLGIVSVIWTFLVAGLPLSFLSSLGIVALSGVIVNNAIVLVDFVNLARSEGLNRWESLERAASQRIRPIFLTSVTTVAGLLPTAHGIGGLDQFVVPIAMALGYGILFGSVLTALFFPCAIAVVDDLQALGTSWRGPWKRS
jgi:multidrug efflux pump subunit AcrB